MRAALHPPIICRMSEASPYKHLIIIGVGLIGGSIAAAARRRWPDCRVTGIGRKAERLQAAQDAGLLSDWGHTVSGIEPHAEAIVIVCLPVDLIPAAVIAAAEATPDSVLITDAGSVKQSIQDGVNASEGAVRQFVGAHPIAGSEQTGFEFADSELFVDRPCIVTPSCAGDAADQRCQEFWKSLGARVSVLNPEEHDRVLAFTSHLPHLMAAVTASCLEQSDLAFAGTGFRDTTRIAAGDAVLWQQILCSNRDQVLRAVEQAEAALHSLSSALQSEDHSAVADFLNRAASLRRSLPE